MEEMARRDKVHEESIRALRAQLSQLQAAMANSDAFYAKVLAGRAGDGATEATAAAQQPLERGSPPTASGNRETGRSTRRLCLELEARERQSQAKLEELQSHVARLEANARLAGCGAAPALGSGEPCPASASLLELQGLPLAAQLAERESSSALEVSAAAGAGAAKDPSGAGAAAQGNGPEETLRPGVRGGYLSSVSEYLSSVHKPNLQGHPLAGTGSCG